MTRAGVGIANPSSRHAPPGRGSVRQLSWVFLALVVASGVLGACSDDSDEGSGEPNPVDISPPAVGGTSSLFAIPLPEDAEPNPTAGGAGPETETYAVAAPVTFADVNAFYRREMEGKSFGEFEWCGPVVDAANEVLTRVWKRPAADEYLFVALRNESPTEPTLISVTKRTAVVVEACPPPQP